MWKLLQKTACVAHTDNNVLVTQATFNFYVINVEVIKPIISGLKHGLGRGKFLHPIDYFSLNISNLIMYIENTPLKTINQLQDV